LSLAVVRDLREVRAPAGPDELAAFETDVLAGFVLARAAAGLADATIRSDVLHLEQVRAWFGRALWEMQPADADAYFGGVLRDAAKGTRLARSQALRTYFLFLRVPPSFRTADPLGSSPERMGIRGREVQDILSRVP
jgi:integrase/recombinase XerD